MNKSPIEWTNYTWNPVTGCTKVSPGCKHCYAERIYERFHGKNSFKHIVCHRDRLTAPLKWKQPSLVFVNSMSDLFHEDVPFEFINAVFSVMSDVDRHTYQVLTKRPERMLEFFDWKKHLTGIEWRPSENVWLGVSVEDQFAADLRIPLLGRLKGVNRFLSCEPLLGPLQIGQLLIENYIAWVICGGESGPKARPMHPAWARALRNQCREADIPFFFKQWGNWRPYETGDGNLYRLGTFNDGKFLPAFKSGEFVQDVMGVTDGTMMSKVGKKAAGRLLDGTEWNQMPEFDGVKDGAYCD
jgi:protein gp37